mmetsp:Transcript_42597/g.89393  ORF Transcript_42597/g.89393 Transcript_42597/m.89393 type:complete len:239 (-) Transcript_42597:303-1019(-)
MTAATAARKPIATKKRKPVSAASSGDESNCEPPKKRSPLFNQPQNFYAPPAIASMSKDQLSEWRKEQRRKRNRESAAASRNKTRQKIEELEGEVSKWKQMYQDMESKMRCMERHIQFLTQLTQSQGGSAAPPSLLPPAPVVSHPNSPPRSPAPGGGRTPPALVVPNAVTSFAGPPPPAYSSIRARTAHPFPPLLSDPKDCALVETQEPAAVAAAPAVIVSNEETSKHLTQIPRQASST